MVGAVPGGVSVRDVCAATLTLGVAALCLCGPTTAFPSRYNDASGAPHPTYGHVPELAGRYSGILGAADVEPLPPALPAKRARGRIRVQPKADRFYLGPRFGKRTEVPDYTGDDEPAEPVLPANVQSPPTPEHVTLQCALASPARLYRCYLSLRVPQSEA